MDKRVIFAVAGSGKTTYIVESIIPEKKYLILTYTDSNYNNLINKISSKYDGNWPSNVTVMTWFRFLFRFCYKPFLADSIRSKGMIFEPNCNKTADMELLSFYLTKNRYFYSNVLKQKTRYLFNNRSRD